MNSPLRYLHDQMLTAFHAAAAPVPHGTRRFIYSVEVFRAMLRYQDFVDDSISRCSDENRDYRSSLDIDIVRLPEIYNHVMAVHRSKSTTPRRPPRRRKRMLAIPGASSSDTLTPLGIASPLSPSKTKSGSRRAPPSLRVPPPQKKRNNAFGFYKHEMPRLTATFSRTQSSKNLPVQKTLQRSKTMSSSNELKKQKKLPVIFELTSPPSRFASSRYTSSKSRLLY